MAATRHSMIAAEGKYFIYGAIIIVLLLHLWLGKPALAGWLLVLFLAWLYRDPRRNIPSLPLGIVSPVDARVVSIGEEQDPYLERQALHIVLQMSPLGMNSLRSVTEGKVMNYWGGPGGQEKAIQIQTDEQDDVVIVLRPGRMLHRLSCNVVAGDRVGQGQRCGHILFGSQVDIYLPTTVRSELVAGQYIKSGSDLIGEFVHY